MKRKWRQIVAVLVSALLIGASLHAPEVNAQAAGGCLPDVGKKVPVLFVHGFNSGPSMWNADSQNSIPSEVKNMGDTISDVFSYKDYSLQWVANKNIGKALADRIVCLATSSRQQGGRGQVVVVAHSMGGLATRQAMVENPQVKKSLGLVITIGTPNDGSVIDQQLLASLRGLCRNSSYIACNAGLEVASQLLTSIPGLAAGSKELSQLADWPPTVPVYAIAGNIALHYNLFGFEFDATSSGSDALVKTASALHSVKANKLGGTYEVRCSGGPPPLLVGWTQGPCEHSALPNNGTVQRIVKDEIKAYLANTPLPGTKPARNLPEPCSPAATYQGPGYTLRATASVVSGSVSCGDAVKLAQSYLEKSGPDKSTTIGSWTCRVVTSGPAGFVAACDGPNGKIQLNGE